MNVFEKLAWRGRYLFGASPFALRERIAFVNPFGARVPERELVRRSLRTDAAGDEYFLLGGFKLYFRPSFPIEDDEAFRDSAELVMRETFLDEDLFDENVEVGAGDCVLDLGAAFGSTVLMFARLVGRQGRVIAVEPLIPDVVERNLSANGVDNAEVVAAAAGAEPGTMTMSFTDEIISGSVARTPGKGRRRVRQREVPVTTVDAVVEERGLDRVDLVKIDIEGAEELAMEGAKETIRRFRPKWTVASYHTDHTGVPQHPKLMVWLRERGYSVREVLANGRGIRIFAW